MQLALRPWSATADLTTDSASNTRSAKILVGTVAALSASVIAVSPAAQNSVAMEIHQIQQAQQRAVQLVAEVTDSPLAVYGDLINNTVYNVSTLLKQYAASPFPILSAVVENQIGYLKRIFDFSSASSALSTWWNSGTRESAPGKTLWANVTGALASGNLGSAYENFNKLALFGLQNTVLTWLNGWLFTSTTSVGVPQQILQNLTDAVGKFFTTGTLVYGAFQALYSPVSGASFELSRALGSVGSALTSGNLVGAITALVNTPGAVLNAFLNGFDYSDATNPWAGLLSPKDPACTGRCAGGGPISQFFITIANNIAAVIKNVTGATSTAATAAATTAAVAAAATTSTTTASDAASVPTAAAASYTLSLTKDTATAASTPEAATAKAADTKSATETAGTTDTATTSADTTKADSASPSTATTDSASTDSAKTDSAKADAAKTDPAKSGSKKSDSTKSDSTSDSAKTDSTKSGSTKHDSSKGGSAKSDSAKSDSAKSDSAKSDSAKSGSAKHDSAKHASAKHNAGSSS